MTQAEIMDTIRAAFYGLDMGYNELSEASGLSYSNTYHLLTGLKNNPSLRVLIALAESLGLTVRVERRDDDARE